jgi:hypothetical protein
VSEGTRTPDTRDHNPVLYQLSYTHHVTCAAASVPAPRLARAEIISVRAPGDCLRLLADQELLGYEPGRIMRDPGGGYMSIDWGGILRPDVPLIELFICGSVIHLVGFTLLRSFPSERQRRYRRSRR